MKIAVLSDIHAMSAALAAALTDARAEGYDVLLILGDLLTYGVCPTETLDLVHDAVARDDAILIMGNHDRIYLDLDDDDSAYLATLPAWLRETVRWTAAQVPARALDAFDWQQSWSCGALFAAHANPGEPGDWTYLNSDARADDAAATLARRGYRYGIFGHTHRARRFDRGQVSLFTLGSLGQPRDDDPRLRWTMIDLEDDAITVAPRTIAFDRDAHCAAIRRTTLSAATQDRLCGFFA